MTRTPLPPEDICVEWLNESMTQHLAGTRVTAFDLKEIRVGEGFMGQRARVSLTTEDALSATPTSITAKFASETEASREVATKRVVLPDIPR